MHHLMALEARNLATNSRLTLLLDAIERRAKSGYSCLELFARYGEGGLDRKRHYQYDDTQLTELKMLGYRVEEITEIRERYFCFFIPLRSTAHTFHTIHW